MMTGAGATRRKERSKVSIAEVRRERALDGSPPGLQDRATGNGAVLQEEAARFARSPSVRRNRPKSKSKVDVQHGQTEEEAELLFQHNLYNG